MLAKTGLLVVSNPKHITKLLTDAQKIVKKTLYIELLSALSEPLGTFHTHVFNSPPKLSRTIYCIYSQVTKQCNNLDVRVLLSGFKGNVSKIQTKNPIDIVIFDKKYSNEEIENFIKNKVTNVSIKHDIVTLECQDHEKIVDNNNSDNNVYKHVVLGGTFDRLHTAHKLLLSDAVLRASETVTVGVTEENMTHSKVLWELIEHIDMRINNVLNFLTDICSELKYDVCKIADPFGPAIVDPTMDVIIVSEETIRGGQKINEIRSQKQLKELKIIPIPFIDEPNNGPKEESKVSSSNMRLRLLGTVINPIVKKGLPKKPYVLGLTGGIASGKSGVATHLENLGVPIINCDKIGHKLYEKDKSCYQLVVETFGSQVVDSNGEIDRRALGGIVFKSNDQLQKLNNIMWPAIAQEVKNVIQNSNQDVICVEAAILGLAGWDSFCHEVWTTIVPPEEAIKRLVSRNNLTEEQAKNRMESQPSNTDYIKKANVVFSPLWEVDYTKLQVHRAWNLLHNRLHES